MKKCNEFELRNMGGTLGGKCIIHHIRSALMREFPDNNNRQRVKTQNNPIRFLNFHLHEISFNLQNICLNKRSQRKVKPIYWKSIFAIRAAKCLGDILFSKWRATLFASNGTIICQQVSQLFLIDKAAIGPFEGHCYIRNPILKEP